MSKSDGGRGIVFDIQRAAMHDGPGIRTTVFLKGCPLRCVWCHNPEAWLPQPQEAEPARPGEPRVIFGHHRSVEEVMDIVRKDRVYYEASGGGLTISGGEPTAQFDFCLALLQAARREGLHTCLDTCGYNNASKFLELLPYVSLFLWDYKATGSHRELTGVSPEVIRKNFEMLYERNAPMLVRAPLVPGVNDSAEDLQAIADLAERFPNLAGIEILPYHDSGMSKFVRLHLPCPALKTHIPNANDMARWRSRLPEKAIIAT